MKYLKQYQKDCLRTANPFSRLELDPIENYLVHSSLGISSELEELADHDGDIPEESGDIMWYVCLGISALGSDYRDLPAYSLVMEPTGRGFLNDRDYYMSILLKESSKLSSLIKRHVFYRKHDREGILQCYSNIIFILTHLTNLEQACIKNIGKLQVRYPERFTEKDALHRNLEAEKAALG